MIYTAQSKLSEPIFSDPSIVGVMGRFDIYPGVGDYTISEICKRKLIDENFFLAVINTYLNPSYQPTLEPDEGNLERVLAYLQKTVKYYKHVQLPNIDRHFNLLLNSAQGSNESDGNLTHLNHFYREVRQEIEEMRVDSFRNEVLEDKMRDLLSFFVIHLKGNYDRNLCLAVLSAIFVLEKDVVHSNRIRERIYQPICDLSGEEDIAQRIKEILSSNKGGDHNRDLSPREIEVLKELAAGKTQKEIADHLCISATTVVTHRKNISAKLGIRSISGLALYAAMKGYI